MKKYTVMYEPGDVITLAGTKFVVLDVEHRWAMPDILFILAKDTFGASTFGNSNNYAKSDLRTAVIEWLDDMEKKGLCLSDIIPRNIDLATLDGCNEYGKMKVIAAPLTLDEARKYSCRIPKTDDGYWLATGWSGYAKRGKDDAVYVTNGGWCSGHCTHFYGIRPALKISAALLNGSEDNLDLSEIPTDALIEELHRRIPNETKGEKDEVSH